MADPVVFENAYVAVTTSTGSSTYVELPGVKSVSLPVSRAELNDAVMGDTIDAKYPGILSVPISITCRQDFSSSISVSGGVDKLANTRLMNRTAFKLKIRPVDAAVSGANPSIILSRVRIFNTTPLDGAHGVALENKIEMRSQSGGTYARSTST